MGAGAANFGGLVGAFHDVVLGERYSGQPKIIVIFFNSGNSLQRLPALLLQLDIARPPPHPCLWINS